MPAAAARTPGVDAGPATIAFILPSDVHSFRREEILGVALRNSRDRLKVILVRRRPEHPTLLAGGDHFEDLIAEIDIDAADALNRRLHELMIPLLP